MGKQFHLSDELTDMDVKPIMAMNNKILNDYHHEINMSMTNGQPRIVMEPKKIQDLDIPPGGAVFFEI